MARTQISNQDQQLYFEMCLRIDKAIYDNGRTKVEVAKACGFERKTLNGFHGMQLNYFARLCKELGVTADYLLFGKTDNIIE